MNTELVEAFNFLSREKNVDRDVLGTILEEIFTMMVRKEYGEEAHFDVRAAHAEGLLAVHRVPERSEEHTS